MTPSTALTAVCPVEVFWLEAVTAAAAATFEPRSGTGTGSGSGTDPSVKASTSESPTLDVESLTEVTVTRTDVVERAGKLTVTPAAVSDNEGTATVEPSEKVRVAPVTWSYSLGRSCRTSRSSSTGAVQVSCSQAPAPCAWVAHSA